MEIKRSQWKTNMGFLLAAIGSAIGLGNIWRFPYVAYENGGGAFLIPYVFALLSAGIPLLMLEFALGHKMKSSAPKAFNKIDPKWEWVGWWPVTFVMFGIVIYYIVIIGWCLNYLVFSFTRAWGTDTNSFFFKQYLNVSSSPFEITSINWQIVIAVIIVWAINWFINYREIDKGIEKAVKIMMPILFLVTIVIIVWSLFLNGAMEGIKHYVTPDFGKIMNPKVWIAAYGQVFFSLSVAFGIMIAYASYMPKKVNLLKSSLIVGFSNSAYEVIAGFGVFSILGYMAMQSGVGINEVVSSGIGLAFVAYPKAISMMPGGEIFGVLFFFLLMIAGITSSISIIEAFTSAILDKFSFTRKTVVSVICLMGLMGSLLFCTNAGLLWVDIVDHFLNSYGLILVGIFEAVIIGWIYNSESLKKYIVDSIDVNSNKGKLFKNIVLHVWMYCIKFITPLVLSVALITQVFTEFKEPYSGYPIPAILILGVGWLLVTHIVAFGISGFSWKKKE